MDFPKVILITATTGHPYLKECLESVQHQTYPNLEHIVVCDGPQFETNVHQILQSIPTKLIPTIQMNIPWNSGANKYICHKIYASIPHLIHEPCYISFLDEDNTITPNHIESMVQTLKEKKCIWTYCLRNIMSPKGEFICRDLCESLGKLHSTFISNSHSPDYLVDTSCYLVPVEIARQFSECWQRPARSHPEGDRYFYECLSKHYKQFEPTLKYTLNYRVEGREDSVKKDFFLLGNSMLATRMKMEKLPWDI
jgi:hypothetical protein